MKLLDGFMGLTYGEWKKITEDVSPRVIGFAGGAMLGLLIIYILRIAFRIANN